ncbi:hypothetical protein G9272_43140 [Streptomyces asoensis]|uniref:Uncharacterized protein n=1 Tax=Streptomyces asoensis TaxID=249586 RepID=A0A6M4X0G1_9ACTN|nr:hypothetical protein G9272_43140 [Streptomyces asoensis]
MVKGIATHAEAVRPELAEVVERVENYVTTAPPDPGLNMKVSLLEHRARLVGAMTHAAA